MDRYIIVYCTVPSNEDALRIAEDMVKTKRAACVNIIPGITSVYRWKGEVCRENEFFLVIKTRESLFESVRDRITAIHPYEVPEIVSLNIADGNTQYLNWVAENTDRV